MAVAVQQIGKRHLYRSRKAYVGGVCAGIADYYEVDSLVVRIMAVLLMLITVGLALVAYLVLWAHIPLEPDRTGPYDVLVEDARRRNDYQQADLYLITDNQGRKELVRLPIRGLSVAVRVGIVVIFFVLSIVMSFVFDAFVPNVSWYWFWPLFPLTVGLFFLVVPIRTRYITAWRGAGLIVTIVSIALLPMCMGLVSVRTIPYTLGLFWPLLLAAAILYVLGIVHQSSAITMFGAFCFVAFCACGAAFCIIPGPTEITETILGIFGAPSLGIVTS